MKLSTKQYRNINGVTFKHYTSDPSQFESAKLEAKLSYKKYRIIDNQFFIQVL